MYSLSGVRVSFLLAFRAGFFYLGLSSILVVLLVAWMAAEFSGRQPATVALDVGISTIRIVVPGVILFLAQVFFSREFERRYCLCSFTYPVGRGFFLVSRFFALGVLIFGFLVVVSLCLALEVYAISKGYEQATKVSLFLPYVITVLFLLIDSLVVVAVAIFISTVSVTPAFVAVGTLGFVLIARSYGSVIELLTRDSWVVTAGETYRSGLGGLSYFLPELGALDVRMAAMYGRLEFIPSDWMYSVLGGLCYVALFMSLSFWALERKKFL